MIRSPLGLRKLLGIGLAGALVVYAVQIASPLRVNGDALAFLEIASSIADGHGSFVGIPESKLPLGYPYLIAALDGLGIANGSVLVGINVLFVGAAVLALWFLSGLFFPDDPNLRLLLLCLTLFSYVWVKHATLPLTEMIYTGISLGALACLAVGVEKRGSGRVGLLSAGAALTVATILVRPIGISLLPVLVLAVAGGRRRVALIFSWVRRSKLRIALVVALVLAAGLVVVFVLTRTEYFRMLAMRYRGRGLGMRLLDVVRYRTNEWARLIPNLPIRAGAEPAWGPLCLLGFLPLLLVIRGAWLRASRLDVADLYVAAYSGMLLIWPFYSPRFWLPVLPLLLMYVTLAVRDLAARRILKVAAFAAVAVYLLLGLVAFGYSTRISLSGDRFPEVYGDGTNRDHYRRVFTGEGTEGLGEEDAKKVELIRRFELRAR